MSSVADDTEPMFASRSLAEHLVRGLVAVGALVGATALATGDTSGGLVWLAAPLILLAIVAMRGCPMCWTVGLFATLARKRARRGCSACVTKYE
jgi:alkylhydroperoxidase family enzyme